MTSVRTAVAPVAPVAPVVPDATVAGDDGADRELLQVLVEKVERSANGSPATSLADAERALGLARRLGDHEAEIRLTYFMGYAYRLLSQDERALEAMQESLGLAQEAGDPVWEASALCGLGAVHANFGDFETALELQERSLTIRRDIDDTFGVAVSLNNLAITLRDLALFPERAREMFNESRGLFAQLGHRHCVADSMSHLAALDVAAAERLTDADPGGATAAARAGAATALEAVAHARTDGGNHRLLADSLIRLAQALLVAGSPDEAEPVLREAEQVAEGLGIPHLALRLVRARARHHRLTGDPGAAVTELLAGLHAADLLVRASERVLLLEELVAAYEQCGDLTQALATHRTLLDATLAQRDASAERRARALDAERELERAQMSAEVQRLRSEQLEMANRVLEHQAMTDGLTGLANRRAFDAALAGRTDGDAALALVVADLDHFKQVNDTYSHVVGDEVLRRVARVLADAVRGTDLVARMGGEEFAVLLSQGGQRAVVAVCERIRAGVAALDLSDVAPGFTATISLGAARRRSGEAAQELVARADVLLYRAKDEGRDRTVLDQ